MKTTKLYYIINAQTRMTQHAAPVSLSTATLTLNTLRRDQMQYAPSTRVCYCIINEAQANGLAA